ncbi:hypothetical protein SAMN04489730_7570 [Amycolatopsis australiensis]|uniref:Uncharacterized protein n=2 Tax=Amycolatopsis australiensis TaxID=546364 RepID=A0A1K1T1S1_9PSEU|nr:hypothetical protein SAMN04489730_7570 [Amycolatopsis australiensis]
MACAAMAVALARSNLEQLSWIAGAGSFVTGVASLTLALVLAVPARHRTRQAPSASDGLGPTVVLLSTSSSRIRHRTAGAVAGVVWAVALMAGAALVGYLCGQPLADVRELGALDPRLLLILFVMFALTGFADAHRDGKDELVLDAEGMTVADRRRLALRDLTFRLCWPQLDCVALRAHSRHGGLHVAVRFTTRFTATGRVADLVAKQQLSRDGAWHVVLELPPEDLDVVKRALARHAGGKFRDELSQPTS